MVKSKVEKNISNHSEKFTLFLIEEFVQLLSFGFTKKKKITNFIYLVSQGLTGNRFPQNEHL